MNVKRHELREKIRDLENIVKAGKSHMNNIPFLTEKAKEAIEILTEMECSISSDIDLKLKENVLRLADNFIQGV